MNILFVSIAAPPKSGAESLQVGKYLHHLSKKSKVTLVTSPAPNVGWKKKDESQSYLLQGVDKIIEINTLSSLGKWRGFAARKLFKRCLNKPDADFLFHWRVNSILKDLSPKPDVIYSRSTPFSSAILANKLKQDLHRPWVMHLSDPWTDSPYGNYKNAYGIEAEKKCFENADMISFTTEETLSFYSEKFPAYKSKFFVCPNVFDSAELVKEQMVFNNQKLILMHSGNLYAKRTIEPLIKSLESLSESEKNSIEVVLAGHLDDYNNQLIESSALKCVHRIGFVSASESYELQRKADILVSIDKPLEEPIDKVFLPSKIQDYIAARKYILAFTGLNSASYNTVHGRYGICFEHDKPDEAAGFLRNAIKAFDQKNKYFFYIEGPDNKFEATHNANMLIERFEQLCSSK
jgi:glycosyltransferase involved in cell wall biosynthesis